MIRLSDGEASARQCHVSLKVTLKAYHDLDLVSNACHIFRQESGAKRLEKGRFSATLSSKTATSGFTTSFGETISREAEYSPSSIFLSVPSNSFHVFSVRGIDANQVAWGDKLRY